MNKVVLAYLKKLRISSNFTRKFGDNQQNTWTFNVRPFWKFKADLYNCNVKIETYDPNEHVDGDSLSIQAVSSREFEEMPDYEVIRNEKEEYVSIINKNTSFPQTINVLTPPIFDIDVELHEKSSLSIANIESVSLCAHNQSGDINVHNVKAKEVTLTSSKGSIISTKLLQGNVKLKADSIYAEKIQSPNASLQVMDGVLALRDAYTDNFDARNENGNITIQSVHGKNKVSTRKGNILIGTVEGEITASAEVGNIDIHVAAPSTVDLSTNAGDVFLSTAHDVGAQLSLKAGDVMKQDIEITSEQRSAFGQCSHLTGVLNGGGPLIKANAMRGIVKLQTSTWMQRIMKFRKDSFKAS